MEYLQFALAFRAVRAGASPDPDDPLRTVVSPGQVGLSAEIVVKNPAVVEKLVLSQIPDIAFFLQDTPDPPDSSGYRPARLYVTQSDTGVEVVIEALPVEIQIPSTLLGLLEPEDAGGRAPARRIADRTVRAGSSRQSCRHPARRTAFIDLLPRARSHD